MGLNCSSVREPELFILGWVAQIQAFMAISAGKCLRGYEEAEVPALTDPGLRSELEITASPVGVLGLVPGCPKCSLAWQVPVSTTAVSCRQAAV